MTLREQQSKFAYRVALLILHAYALGYELTLGDAKRDVRCPYGNKKSFHHKQLAIDLNLFEDGDYLDETEHHKPLGLYWESLGGTWGGRWGDGNHYSWGEV